MNTGNTREYTGQQGRWNRTNTKMCSNNNNSTNNTRLRQSYSNNNNGSIIGSDNDNNDIDKLNLAGLLNALDRVVDTPGRNVIIATHYPYLLDPALIRPSRINK